MVWYFIGVHIINRTLHGRLEKRNFVSPCGHVISSIFFPSLRAGGNLQTLQSDWFRERAVLFYDLARSCPLTRAESLAALFIHKHSIVGAEKVGMPA